MYYQQVKKDKELRVLTGPGAHFGGLGSLLVLMNQEFGSVVSCR
jgi:hypothetical protein